MSRLKKKNLEDNGSILNITMSQFILPLLVSLYSAATFNEYRELKGLGARQNLSRVREKLTMLNQASLTADGSLGQR